MKGILSIQRTLGDKPVKSGFTGKPVCAVCGGQLTGRQSRFCSRNCKNRATNNRLQSYAAQQERGRRRKLDLIRLKGGRCEHCGYSRNYAALEFHHETPEEKGFELDLRAFSNRRWEALLAEAQKCLLLCSNCHAEVHHPQCLLSN